MSPVDADLEVGTVCARRPLAVGILQRYGIDPRAPRSLAACCQDHGLAVASVVAEIDAAEDAFAGPWRMRSIIELLDHVLRTYHRPFAAEFDAVAVTLEDVRPSTEPALTAWSELRRRFDELRLDLEHHMDKEEQVLFPWLRGRAETAAVPIRAMQLEHTDTIQLLLGVHAAAAWWLSMTSGARERAATASLERLARWLCEHLHLENNELFRRALERS